MKIQRSGLPFLRKTKDALKQKNLNSTYTIQVAPRLSNQRQASCVDKIHLKKYTTAYLYNKPNICVLPTKRGTLPSSLLDTSSKLRVSTGNTTITLSRQPLGSWAVEIDKIAPSYVCETPIINSIVQEVKEKAYRGQTHYLKYQEALHLIENIKDNTLANIKVLETRIPSVTSDIAPVLKPISILQKYSTQNLDRTNKVADTNIEIVEEQDNDVQTITQQNLDAFVQPFSSPELPTEYISSSFARKIKRYICSSFTSQRSYTESQLEKLEQCLTPSLLKYLMSVKEDLNTTGIMKLYQELEPETILYIKNTMDRLRTQIHYCSQPETKGHQSISPLEPFDNAPLHSTKITDILLSDIELCIKTRIQNMYPQYDEKKLRSIMKSISTSLLTQLLKTRGTSYLFSLALISHTIPRDVLLVIRDVIKHTREYPYASNLVISNLPSSACDSSLPAMLMEYMTTYKLEPDMSHAYSSNIWNRLPLEEQEIAIKAIEKSIKEQTIHPDLKSTLYQLLQHLYTISGYKVEIPRQHLQNIKSAVLHTFNT
ncbi:MAG: hypothetical protein K2M30_02550, partial [Desulfovibrionaceae bacterium]|nr:hypothetical protein [Desulfovibrionaceae bacterium]